MMAMFRIISCVAVEKRVFAMISMFSWQNSISLCPASFCTSRTNLPVTAGISWFPTFVFQYLVMKRTSFFDVRYRRSCRSSSVQLSRSVMSDSLRPHESQHARPPCPSPTPGVYPNSCPLSLWCHPAISSTVFPFSSCPQSLPASESFPMSQLFSWGGQSIGVSALASFLPPRTALLQNELVGSPCHPRDSQEKVL